MQKRESLWGKVPDYSCTLEPDRERRTVTFHGVVLAESERALVVRESRHAPVLYFPREDVRLEHMERTDHQSFCPFKGEASYWTLRSGEAVEQNAAWSYEQPFDEVAGLKDHVAFYADRVEGAAPKGH
jgi:uncharacterized protein (DUF427 family)